VLADLKTGGKFEYSMPAYAVQMALYAAGRFYDVVTDDFIETPDINQRWGLVVHMPANEPGRCEFLWVDLEVGRYGCYIVEQVKLWRRNWRAGEFEFALAAPLGPEPTTIGLSDTVEDEPVAEPIAPAANGDGLNPVADGVIEVWGPAEPTEPAISGADDDGGLEADSTLELDAHVAWAKQRLLQVSQHEAATKRLMLLWPVGLPTPKQGIKTMEQVMEVHSLLAKVEADFELSFVPMPKSILGSGPSTRKRRT